jgi:hypothetical protein
VYDRCPLCRGNLYFHGISIRPAWLKWLWCPHDETYVSANEFGMIQGLTKRIPKEAYFVVFREKRGATA